MIAFVRQFMSRFLESYVELRLIYSNGSFRTVRYSAEIKDLVELLDECVSVKISMVDGPVLLNISKVIGGEGYVVLQ